VRLRRRSKAPTGELLELAQTPTWMYAWDLGGGVQTSTMNDELMSVHRTRRAIMEPLVRQALAAAGPHATAVDLACNEGWFAHQLLEWGASRVIGVDIRPENVHRAELVRDHLGVDPARLSYRLGDVYDLGGLGEFDVVLCLGLIYHLENPVGGLRIARSLTVDGGLCIVESQLTEQIEPIRHGWGSTDEYLEQPASWAAWYEPAVTQANHPVSSFGGVVSFIPNRAALTQALHAAGFSRVEEPAVAPGLNPQYVGGHRLVAAAWR
jgi:tRNA (mo5U34)-methyltransferase